MGHDYGNFQPRTMTDYYLDNPWYLGYGNDNCIDNKEVVNTREIIIIKEVTEKGNLKRELINPIIFL